MYSTNSQFQPSASYLNQNHHQDANTNTHSYNPYYSPSNTATGMPRPSGPSHSISNSQIGFSVAGMSSSTSGHHHGGISSWSVGPGQGLGSSMNEGFGQSRSHYQPGYLMSMSQNSTSPQGGRVDELPIVQTKAKMTNTLKRNTTSEFGKDPMFESSRRHPTLDEDAPPMASVNDIVNATYPDNKPSTLPSRRFDPHASATHRSTSHSHSQSQARAPSSLATEPIYVIVFGYPADRYSVTAEYFKHFGDCTDADPNTEIINCFRIGYRNPADAMRAVRKNGEVIGGSWMVGVKYADPVKAESLLGSSFRATSALDLTLSSSPSNALLPSNTGGGGGDGDDPMSIDDLPPCPPNRSPSLRQPQSPSSPAPRLGTPLKIAPASSAFKKSAAGGAAGGVAGGLPGSLALMPSAVRPIVGAGVGGGGGTPGKGVLGQVSDLIFGW